MNNPVISVIVPIYKVEQYLERCMQSIINQTYSNLEIIMIDDGSPDKCPFLCDQYAIRDSRIKVLHKENQGLGLARNSGLDVATGKYVCFVDSDDYLSVDAIEKLLISAETNNADIVYGAICKDKGNNNIVPGDAFSAKWEGEEQVKSFLLDLVGTKPSEKRDNICEVSVWKALFRRDIIEKNKIRFVSEREFISEDLIFDIDLIPKCRKIVMISDIVYYYCSNGASLSKTFREDRFNQVKNLYSEVVRKLKYIYSEEEFTLRTDRMMLAKTRVIIRQISATSKIKKQKKIRLISDIQEDFLIKEILNRYPYKKLPLKYVIFNWGLKFRLTWFLYYISK